MSSIGIIGGSGLYSLDGLSDIREVEVETPFGSPSDVLVTGELGGARLVFLPRHGRGHRLLPTEVPYRANIYALKKLGVRWIISVSAVGSMREAIEPGDFVLPDQFIDRTHQRTSTFFGDGIAAHVSVADPTCPSLANCIADAIEAEGVRCHRGGTYVCIEGPAFSTRAESRTYRSWDVSVIGMTAVPEYKLAREAEIHYQTIALATDYDCWHEEQEDVTADAVLKILQQNTANVRRVLKTAITRVAALESPACGCASALARTILTDPKKIPPATRERLALLLGEYL